MPTARLARSIQPAAKLRDSTAISPTSNECHLTITTSRQVLSWDSSGLTCIFKSGSGGILTARESKDGSGLLAIADSQVVLLYDVVSGQDRSYRLKGADDHVRLIEYCEDSKRLIFTTTLQNTLQSYSVQQDCLLSPLQTHPSPPTVLATAPNSPWIISASEQPPVIFVQNANLQSPPVQLKVSASSGTVSAARIHPERPNIFLLGFRDGTLAAYDSTAISRAETARTTFRGGTLKARGDGEIDHFKSLHRVTTENTAAGQARTCGLPTSEEPPNDETSFVGSSRCSGITAAAFLPGHKARAVSVGSDGRCRIVDFENGGKILRTWHVQAPATSISVLDIACMSSTKTTTSRSRQRSAASRSGATVSSEGSGVPGGMIAIGRVDGKVLIYDTLGSLLEEIVADADGGHVVSIEWIMGGRPNSDQSHNKSHMLGRSIAESALEDAEELGTVRRKSKVVKCVGASLHPRRVSFALQQDGNGSVFDNDGRDAATAVFGGPNSTVKHVEIDGPIGRELPPITSGNYMDLFSPVKLSPPKRTASSRPRPRLSSSTFVNVDSTPRVNTGISDAVPSSEDFAGESNPVPIENHPSFYTSSTEPTAPEHLPTFTPRKPTTKGRRVSKGRRKSQRAMPGGFIKSSTGSMEPQSSSSSANSKILADLKRFAATGAMRKTSNLALLAPYMEPRQPFREPTHTNVRRWPDRNESKPGGNQYQSSDVHGEDRRIDDIWLTSDEEDPVSKVHRQKHPSLTRSYQPSMPHQRKEAPTEATTNALRHHLGRRRGESSSAAIVPTLAPGAAQSPVGPLDVADFFPRTSSRSPTKVQNNQTKGVLISGAPNGNPEYATRLGTSAAKVDDGDNCDCGSACCAGLRRQVHNLQKQMTEVQEQMAILRGLGRARSVGSG